MMTANMATIVDLSVQGKSILKGVEVDGVEVRGARKAHEERSTCWSSTWLLDGLFRSRDPRRRIRPRGVRRGEHDVSCRRRRRSLTVLDGLAER